MSRFAPSFASNFVVNRFWQCGNAVADGDVHALPTSFRGWALFDNALGTRAPAGRPALRRRALVAKIRIAPRPRPRRRPNRTHRPHTRQTARTRQPGQGVLLIDHDDHDDADFAIRAGQRRAVDPARFALDDVVDAGPDAGVV